MSKMKLRQLFETTTETTVNSVSDKNTLRTYEWDMRITVEQKHSLSKTEISKF